MWGVTNMHGRDCARDLRRRYHLPGAWFWILSFHSQIFPTLVRAQGYLSFEMNSSQDIQESLISYISYSSPIPDWPLPWDVTFSVYMKTPNYSLPLWARMHKYRNRGTMHKKGSRLQWRCFPLYQHSATSRSISHNCCQENNKCFKSRAVLGWGERRTCPLPRRYKSGLQSVRRKGRQSTGA